MNLTVKAIIIIVFLIAFTDGSVREDAFQLELVPILCKPDSAIFSDNYCVQCLETDAMEGSLEDCVFKDFDYRNQTAIVVHEEAGPICCFQDPADQSNYRTYLGIQYFANKTINVVTISRPPFVMISTDGQYSGVIFEFLAAVQEKFNTQANVFQPYDGNWGSPLFNGTWNGMIGQVIRGEADIGAAGFSVTYQRFQAVDFTIAFYQEPSAILIPPPTEGEKLTVLIRPLSKPVWGAVMGTILFLIPILYTFHNISRSIRNYRRSNGLISMSSEILWFILGSILQQGLTSPVEKSTRFVTAIWWFVTLIIANTYIAFLVSYLSAPKLYNVVDSLEALSKQHKLKWTFRSNTAHFALFKSETSAGVYKLVGDKTSITDLVPSDRDGVDALLTKKHAFIKEKSYLEVAIANDFESVKQCRMTLAKQTFFTVGIALAVAKGSPILDVLDFELSHSISTGLMEKWKNLHWPKNLQCIDAASYIISTRPRARKLDLDDVQGAYFLLATGITLALTSFIAENILVAARYRIYFILFKWKLATVWKFLR